MTAMPPHQQLDKRIAIQLITSLKPGRAPEWSPAAIRFLHVGREDWLSGMRWYLKNCREADLSGLRVIKGHYGDGKSHFLYMTMAMAL